MAERAAIVTGASRGIGLAIARVLAQEGHAVTLSSRQPDRLEAAARALAGEGHDVQHVAANVAHEEDLQRIVAAHRERYGRLDVLVNNAGLGVGGPVGETVTRRLDLQLDVNLRAVVLLYRESLDLLRQAGAQHGSAWVINTASLAGKSGEAWLSVYSATKAGLIGFTQAMNRELAGEGIKSCALCPGFVDTDLSEFVHDQIKPEEMIRPEDVAEGVRYLLRLSRFCVVPEIVLTRPGQVVA
jgi:NAD(P)-dependent dehydrogenase (short-subunit alcohol dehydrogenase family)